MITFTTEVEGILNMRPLTTIEENPDVPGLIPLRPVDFLCPKRNLCLELEIPKTDDSIMNFVIKYKDSFVFTEFLLNELWKRWKKEYLIWLRDRSQWAMKGPRSQTKREPNVGEIVILEEEFVPRNLWKIAKIIELLDTKDGRCVRNVKILLPNGTIVSRPINRLYPLEVDIENKEIENIKNKEIEKNFKEKAEGKPKEVKIVNQINIISKEITKNLVNISTMLFTFCLILIMFGIITAKTQCNDCLVECNDKGILISSPEKIDKYEICCSDGPCTTHSRVDQFQFEINKEILVTHHHCENGQSHLFSIHIALFDSLFNNCIWLFFSNGEIISRTARTETCFRKNGKIDCSWNFVETLTMTDNKERQTIVLKDNKNKILGQINLTPEGFKMKCEPIVEKYLRSYEVKIQTVKSCPETGSCHHDNCLIVNNNWEQDIKELEPWKNYTGYNRCSASCSFLWCKCGMSTGFSCLFYRIYVEPTNPDIYEVFTCKWIPIFTFSGETIFLSEETKENQESLFEVQPGMIVHDKNFTISVTQFSLPPEPEMNGKFIGNKKFVSLINDIYSNVFCKNYLAAEKFECDIREEICQECLPDHDNEKVDCKCKNLELDSLILDTQRILPIKTQTLDLNYDGLNVYSEIYDL
uniref:DUF5641 domain-containing protein n=1 Tax=Meloidogyne incognita TaxID=6306 RepID=A0A914L4A5_MELIC